MRDIRKTTRIILLLLAFACTLEAHAQRNSDRLMTGMGALYENGLDATLSWDHETRYHNAWEYFLNGYVKWSKDPSVGHITRKSFWHNYRTWGAGVAYKPCVTRGHNNHGNLRLGASLGSDTHEVVGWVNVGYERDYVLRHGLHVYWQVKSDLCINGEDLFRTGLVIGIKLPTNKQ